MGRLLKTIQSLVQQDRYLVGEHASERLDERGILEWQLVESLDVATLIEERPRSMPHPSVEVYQLLADGTTVKVIWSHLSSLNVAKLVTVHFLDRP